MHDLRLVNVRICGCHTFDLRRDFCSDVRGECLPKLATFMIERRAPANPYNNEPEMDFIRATTIPPHDPYTRFSSKEDPRGSVCSVPITHRVYMQPSGLTLKPAVRSCSIRRHIHSHLSPRRCASGSFFTADTRGRNIGLSSGGRGRTPAYTEAAADVILLVRTACFRVEGIGENGKG